MNPTASHNNDTLTMNVPILLGGKGVWNSKVNSKSQNSKFCERTKKEEQEGPGRRGAVGTRSRKDQEEQEGPEGRGAGGTRTRRKKIKRNQEEEGQEGPGRRGAGGTRRKRGRRDQEEEE